MLKLMRLTMSLSQINYLLHVLQLNLEIERGDAWLYTETQNSNIFLLNSYQ